MRRALCVGVDDYGFGSLHGCVSDAEQMQAVLATNHDGSPNFDCRILVAPSNGQDYTVTRVTLKCAVKELFGTPANVALFHFSGHGTINDLDGYLVTQDATVYDEGLSMSEVLKMANASRASEVLIFLDCCRSGSLGNPPVVDNTKAMLREGVSILTASRGDQPAVEAGGGGIFTSLVVDALKGGAADILGCVTAPAIYSFVEGALGAWDQRPLFKSHVAQVVSLRDCQPPIDRTVLRELPSLFPIPAEDFPLSPEFEPSSDLADVGKKEIFSKLQQLNRVHLVVPVDAPHMYDAAMQSKGCRLTSSGLYYWRLAAAGRI